MPKHWVGDNIEEQTFCNSSENLIYLTVEEHVKAHQILYELYGKAADNAAVQMLQGDKAESRRIWRAEGAKAVHKKLKAEGRTLWDKKYQKEMSDRSMSRPDALLTRSEGGKKGGRTRNLNRAITKFDRYLFYFNDKPVLCCLNCETGGDVLRQLHAFKQTNLIRASQLLNGSRKSLHGWSCEKLN